MAHIPMRRRTLVAGALGFRPAEFFGLDDRAEGAAPSIDLGGGR